MATLKEFTESGSDIDRQDEHGWTLLSVSAGKGDAASVRRLLEKGADIFKTGRDQRTPYMIALAAGHLEIAKSLKKGMERRKGAEAGVNERLYCRAYFLKELRMFPGWSENGLQPREENESAATAADEPRRFSDTDVVFLHQDLSVTASMWYGAHIIFNQVTPAWTEFTRSHLNFSAPEITDLLT